MRHADGEPLEQAASFLQALREEEFRTRDLAFFDNCRQYYWNFLYAESSRYDIQLKRYLDLYNLNHFHFLSLAELNQNPHKSLASIATFLDIDPQKNLSLEAQRVSPAHPPMCTESLSILKERLEGVTTRTEEFAGRKFDWSL